MRRIWMTVFALSVVYTAATFLSRRAAEWKPARRVVSGRPLPAEYSDPTGLHILHFYAAVSSLVEGEKTTICYGVLNAASVRMDPSPGEITPSINRCVEIAPEATTRYTLYATGKDGQKAAAVFELPVRADPTLLPRFKKVWTGAMEKDRFGLTAHCLCFEAENTATIDIEPKAFAAYHGVTGCFWVVPDKTTTYTLIGHDKKGREARKSITVDVKPRGEARATMRA
jgi:hypothetical protein